MGSSTWYASTSSAIVSSTKGPALTDRSRIESRSGRRRGIAGTGLLGPAMVTERRAPLGEGLLDLLGVVGDGGVRAAAVQVTGALHGEAHVPGARRAILGIRGPDQCGRDLPALEEVLLDLGELHAQQLALDPRRSQRGIRPLAP